jgi:hypothetical protein
MTTNRFGKYSSLTGILISGFLILILNSSFSILKNITPSLFSDDLEIEPNYLPVDQSALYLPFFPKIYSGSEIDYMNINLVNLSTTGLNLGDEIGVFDGDYCVGGRVIEEKHMTDNSISIPASANNSQTSTPNGYIPGHKITLKIYRTGKVYLLYFQTVNNTVDVFEKGGSMFALVDFSKSTGQTSIHDAEQLKIYPTPFTDNLKIEINLQARKNLNVTIFDSSGKLIRILFDEITEGPMQISWDGNDYSLNHVPSGVYFCKVNHTSYKIIHQ